MAPATKSAFPHLERPPIAEVVCGFAFSPIEALDAFEFGVYWDQRRDEFPDKQVRVGLADPNSLSLSSRAWLISPDDGEFLLQLQSDRFYVNWRRRKNRYPRFSDENQQRPGLRSIALREFEKFTDFCSQRPTIGKQPQVNTIELTKIDMLRRRRDWSSLEDLAALLPITETFTAIRQSSRIQLSLSENEKLDNGSLSVRLNSISDENGELDIVRLESRVEFSLAQGEDPSAAFGRANTLINEAFFGLVKDATARFGEKE